MESRGVAPHIARRFSIEHFDPKALHHVATRDRSAPVLASAALPDSSTVNTTAEAEHVGPHHVATFADRVVQSTLRSAFARLLAHSSSVEA